MKARSSTNGVALRAAARVANAPVFGFTLAALLAGASIAPLQSTFGGEDVAPFVELRVSPNGDDESADGSVGSPFGSIQRALYFAEETGSRPVRVLVAEGEFRDAAPILVPPELLEVEIVGAAIDRTAIVGERSPGSGPAVFAVVAETQHPALVLRLRDLTLRDGLSGVLLWGEQHLNVELESCAFSDLAGPAVRVAPGLRSESSVSVRNCRFARVYGGVVVDAARGSRVDLDVERSLFEELIPYGYAGRLGAGVALHIDAHASVSARIAQNEFDRAPSAVQMTASERFGGIDAAGTLDVQVSGNVIRRTVNACYLSLWPHHEVSISIVNNTIVQTEGFVVYHDNLDALGAAASDLRWSFVNNLCWETGGESEFDLEVAAGLDWNERFPKIRAVHNFLTRSRLSRDGVGNNVAPADAAIPPFREFAAGADEADFHLRESSNAVDRGENAAVLDVTSFDGECRFSRTSCTWIPNDPLPPATVDIGAFEAGAYCGIGVRPFLRGDCNSSGRVEISDGVAVFEYLFSATGFEPTCPDACDADDNSVLVISDGIRILLYLFSDGIELAAPGALELAVDQTSDCFQACR